MNVFHYARLLLCQIHLNLVLITETSAKDDCVSLCKTALALNTSYSRFVGRDVSENVVSLRKTVDELIIHCVLVLMTQTSVGMTVLCSLPEQLDVSKVLCELRGILDGKIASVVSLCPHQYGRYTRTVTFQLFRSNALRDC